MMTSDKIPLTVIGGFLGSGKTTLLNHLLSTTSGRRIAVLVNDFGQINIDAQLIAKHEGETISLTNGCVCCSIGSGLDAALIEVLELTPPPDWIVIEASGVSDPARIAEVGLTDPSLRLAGVVTVVSAEDIVSQGNDPLLQETIVRQVSAADLLILNKVDLVCAKRVIEVKDYLTQRFDAVPILEARNAQVPEDILFDTELGRDRASESAVVLHRSTDSDHPFVSYTWTGPGVFSAERLMTCLKQLPRAVIRMKGLVVTDYHGPVLISFAGRRAQFHAIDSDQTSGVVNQLVCIGLPPGCDEDVLHHIVEHCLLAGGTT